MAEEEILPSDYAHSPAHHAVVLGDPAALSRLLSSLSSSPEEAELVLDRRDVPRRETPLHLAVRLGLPSAAAALAGAGADPSLQDAAGWTPLQTALALRRRRLAALLLRHHRRSALAKLRRRLPPLLAALRRIPDSYLEIHFRFESPLLPFLPRAAPSDTYRLWKRGADLRADTSLAGFDGLRVRRAPHTFLFLASSAAPNPSLLVLDRSKHQIQDALYLDDDDDELGDEANAYRPGLDITKAELVPSTNWRRKERTEMVGEWKAKVYDVHNVVFSFKTLKAAEGGELEREEEEALFHLPLELDEESEEGFLVAELPPRHSCYERGRFGNSAREEVREERRRSLDVPPLEDKRWERIGRAAGKCKEKEMVKSLRPTVWLTEDFPLTTEEFLPLLDVLASKVKAVRRLRELLTTKFPPGTFPVKVAIPIVPTVRVVVTFTKFVDLQPSEQFFTPLSSPRLFSPPEGEVDRPKAENGSRKGSWLKWNASSKSISPSQVADPFAIPADYTWVSKSKSQGMKKTKSRKGKS